MQGKIANDVDEYISWQPDIFKKMLKELRELILETAPDADEIISYQIPTYKLYYSLVGFGTTKKYCSFYSMSPELIKSLKEELGDIKYSGATIHLDPAKKLPKVLLKKIVKNRIKENLVRARKNNKI